MALILLAGGNGRRLQAAVADKSLADIGGRPLPAWSLAAAAASGIFTDLVVVFRDGPQRRRLAALLPPPPPAGPVWRVTWVRAGPERRDSVRHALEALRPVPAFTFVHDAARPFVTAEDFTHLLAAVEADGAAVLATPVTDTVKRLRETPARPERAHLEDLDRTRLWAMQTPQAFRGDGLLAAYRAAGDAPLTDDAAAWARAGGRVTLLDPGHPNPKLTRPEDLPWFEFLAGPTLPCPPPRPNVSP